ncbi:MAG: hypothetical protein EXS05_10130 [Planctomycetaceae bacterium]|nr:hypothetical protein [Planctomycetaceae bacterium]
MSRFRQVTPRMRVADLSQTIDFYTNVLGFSVDVLWPDEQPRTTKCSHHRSA